MDQLPPALLNRKNDRKYRSSVSAEAFGKFNIKKEFVPPVKQGTAITNLPGTWEDSGIDRPDQRQNFAEFYVPNTRGKRPQSCDRCDAGKKNHKRSERDHLGRGWRPLVLRGGWSARLFQKVRPLLTKGSLKPPRKQSCWHTILGTPSESSRCFITRREQRLSKLKLTVCFGCWTDRRLTISWRIAQSEKESDTKSSSRGSNFCRIWIITRGLRSQTPWDRCTMSLKNSWLSRETMAIVFISSKTAGQ